MRGADRLLLQGLPAAEGAAVRDAAPAARLQRPRQAGAALRPARHVPHPRGAGRPRAHLRHLQRRRGKRHRRAGGVPRDQRQEDPEAAGREARLGRGPQHLPLLPALARRRLEAALPQGGRPLVAVLPGRAQHADHGRLVVHLRGAAADRGHRRQGVHDRPRVRARRGAQEPGRRRQGDAQAQRQGGALPRHPHGGREGDGAQDRARLRADGVRLRPAPLQRAVVRVRRQRLVVRQGLAAVLVGRGGADAPVLPRGARAGAPGQVLAVRRDADVRGRAVPERAARRGHGRRQPDVVQGVDRRAVRAGRALRAAVPRRRHVGAQPGERRRGRAAVHGGADAARRPHAEAEAQVHDQGAELALDDHQVRRQLHRRAQDQEGAPHGGALRAHREGRRSAAGGAARARRVVVGRRHRWRW